MYVNASGVVTPTTLGSLATKSEVAKTDLASGVQTSLDAADAALPAATYNTQVGTVSAANMGTTASTVVTAIKELSDSIGDLGDTYATDSELSTALADYTATADLGALATKDTVSATEIDNNAVTTDKINANAVTLAKLSASLPNDCTATGAECVLKSSNGALAWEVIRRASGE